eukprot:2746256-Pyramimonas_sp.AAC.1
MSYHTCHTKPHHPTVPCHILPYTYTPPEREQHVSCPAHPFQGGPRLGEDSTGHPCYLHGSVHRPYRRPI